MTVAVQKLLPPDFKESLALIPKNTPITLFTRHSIREEPENYNAHYKLPLTEQGRALATYWGGLQPFDEFRLFSSPVGRCVETAEHMFRGNNPENSSNAIQIQQESLLAEPGCFIADIKIMHTVGQIFVSEGPISFINRMISGNFEEHLSVKEGVKKLLDYFIRHQHQQSLQQLNIHVSHDTILAAFVYSLLGKQNIEANDWPRMMEGVYLWFEDNHVHGVWRGKNFKTSINDYL